jgi:uncharacterized protein YjbI with pentapeptide repeats
MNSDLILGWFLGLAGSLISGVALSWLQGRRDIKNEVLRQRREDTRTARNWANDGRKASLRGFDLRGENLSGKDLAGADLESANLEGASLWATNLSGANLRKTNLRNTKLKGAELKGAMLLLADFTGASIIDTDFTGAILKRANLQVKTAENCVWKDVQIDDGTEMSPELMQEIERQLSWDEKNPAKAESKN